MDDGGGRPRAITARGPQTQLAAARAWLDIRQAEVNRLRALIEANPNQMARAFAQGTVQYQVELSALTKQRLAEYARALAHM